MRRSFVLIVDQEYDSWQSKELAHKVINKFFDSLKGSDLFGLIGLGKDSKRYGIMLEPKDCNLSVKKKFPVSVPVEFAFTLFNSI